MLENTNSCFILWVFISTAHLYHCLDFVLIGGKVVSFLVVLEKEFIGKPSVAIFWELTFEVEFLDCSRNQPVFVCDQRLLCVGQLDSSALPALEMEQLVSSGLKRVQSGEYKENRRHFLENLGTEAVRLTPEGCGQQSKWLLEEPRKVPLDPGWHWDQEGPLVWWLGPREKFVSRGRTNENWAKWLHCSLESSVKVGQYSSLELEIQGTRNSFQGRDRRGQAGCGLHWESDLDSKGMDTYEVRVKAQQWDQAHRVGSGRRCDSVALSTPAPLRPTG